VKLLPAPLPMSFDLGHKKKEKKEKL